MKVDLPALPGAYGLEFSLEQPRVVRVGRRGVFAFPAGEYIYLGSARGPGGLQARLGRHLGRLAPTGERAARASHWHVDYVLPFARRRAWCYCVIPAGAEQGLALECAWSQFLLGMPGAVTPARGFGASDCRNGCAAHLVAFPGVGGQRLLAEAGVFQGMARAAGLSPGALSCQWANDAGLLDGMEDTLASGG